MVTGNKKSVALLSKSDTPTASVVVPAESSTALFRVVNGLRQID